MTAPVEVADQVAVVPPVPVETGGAAAPPAAWAAAARCGAAIRPARAGDVEDVRRFLAGLTLQSAYRRFFTGLGTPSLGLVRRLVEVDHGRREALLAVAAGEVIGLANYAAAAGRPDRVEFGVVVADASQGRGLGTALTTAVLRLAAERGARSARAYTLAENASVVRLLRRYWPTVTPGLEDTLLVWDLPLPVPGPVAPILGPAAAAAPEAPDAWPRRSPG